MRISILITVTLISMSCHKKSDEQRRLDFCCSQGAAATLLSGISVLVPNIVTPNGDGINDTLVIIGWDYYSVFDLTLWDSDSNVVFHDTDYANNWIPSNIPGGTYAFELLADKESINGYMCIYSQLESCNNNCIITSHHSLDPAVQCP